MKYNILFVILFLIVLTASGALTVSAANVNNQNSVKRGYVSAGNMIVENNWWGSTDVLEGMSGNATVYLDGTIGWSWNRSNPLPYTGSAHVYDGTAKAIYPSCGIGGGPYTASNIQQFPIKVTDIDILILDMSFQYNIEPTSTKYNFAFDIWLTTDANIPNGGMRAGEIMIRLFDTFTSTAGLTYRGTFNDGYNTYELWTNKGENLIDLDGWEIYSFVLHDSFYKSGLYTVDIGKLISQIVGFYSFNGGWYFDGIELGNEVWNGIGDISITNYSINLNGEKIYDAVKWR